MKGEKYLKYETVKNWISSLEQSATSRGKDFTEGALSIRLRTMYDYVEFNGLNPDELIEKAKGDLNDAMTRLTQYHQMLRERIGKRGKKTSWNSACTLQCYIRGFYTHNDLTFPKRFKVPKRRVSAVSKRDTKTEIYGYDEENDEIIYRNGTLQHFISNLNFRDQTIALCLLSTGTDASDLLALNVGFVKDAKGNISKTKRFLWHDNRLKDGIEFKVYFSEEATQFLKRYVEQERAGASGDEPLFAKENGERLPAHALAMNFRASAKKMGYVKKDESSPFRPKRFRHLFRTACGNAHIDTGFTNVMMGHVTDVSAGYLEKSNGLFLKEYVRVEPYITVFGVEKSDVIELSEKVEGLNRKVDESKDKMTELYESLHQKDRQIQELDDEVKALEERDREIVELKRQLTEQQKQHKSLIITNVDRDKRMEEMQASISMLIARGNLGKDKKTLPFTDATRKRRKMLNERR